MKSIFKRIRENDRSKIDSIKLETKKIYGLSEEKRKNKDRKSENQIADQLN